MQEIVKQYGNFLLAAAALLSVLAVLLVQGLTTDGMTFQWIGQGTESYTKSTDTEENRSTLSASAQTVVDHFVAQQPSVEVAPNLKVETVYPIDQVVRVDGEVDSIDVMGVWDISGKKITGQAFDSMWDVSTGSLQFAQPGMYILKVSIDSGQQRFQRALSLGVSR